MKNQLQKYKQTQVQSASRKTLLLMMYEGAIRFTKKAITACEEKNISEKGLNVGRAYDVVMELNNTLDHKVGGNIARDLEQLYMFVTDSLTQGNVTGDPSHLRAAVKVLE